MRYEILQLKHNDEARELLFLSYDDVKEKCSTLADILDLYSVVYFGEIEDSSDKFKVLEDLFRIFNIDHPEDFRGHSLSVSDIVSLEANGECEYWFCDRFGWKLLDKVLV